MCKRDFVLSTFRNRYLRHLLTCYCGSYRYHPGMGGFPDREWTTFQTRRLGLMLRRKVPMEAHTHRVSQFVKSQNPTGNTQVLCFLILFAEDVDPDKVLRRYQWSRSGGQGVCERCPRCIQVLPQFGMRGVVTPIFTMQFFYSSAIQFKASTTQGAYWWSERRCNTCCTSERSGCEHGA